VSLVGEAESKNGVALTVRVKVPVAEVTPLPLAVMVVV
jgi:hypothetical protein